MSNNTRKRPFLEILFSDEFVEILKVLTWFFAVGATATFLDVLIDYLSHTTTGPFAIKLLRVVEYTMLVSDLLSLVIYVIVKSITNAIVTVVKAHRVLIKYDVDIRLLFRRGRQRVGN